VTKVDNTILALQLRTAVILRLSDRSASDSSGARELLTRFDTGQRCSTLFSRPEAYT
jgi:hypothetical protein